MLLRKVYFVDDDKDEHMLFKSIVQEVNSDIELSCFSGGEEILAYLTRHTPCSHDLLVLDVNMPKMNGREALKEIKSLVQPNMPKVLMHTTTVRNEDLKEFFRLSADFYMEKYTFSVTIKEVRNLLLHLEKYKPIPRESKVIVLKELFE